MQSNFISLMIVEFLGGLELLTKDKNNKFTLNIDKIDKN